MCAGVINSTQHQACSKSLEAAGIEYGIVERTHQVEHFAQVLVDKNTMWAGREARFVAATAYSLGVNKNIALTTAVPYPFQSVEVQGYVNRALISFRWSF